MENKTLAIVNGNEIKKSDLDFMFANLSPQVASQFIGPEGEKKLLSELINQKLLLVDALESNMDASEEFELELAKLKENLLSQFAVKKIIGSVTTDEAEAKSFYDEHPEYFMSPAQIRASHILVSEEEKANQLYEQIQGGADFAELAKDNSSCPSSSVGGDLNYFGKGQMVPEFEEAVFALEINQVSKPVKTQFGYHLIQLTDKKEEDKVPFEQAKENIIQNLTAQKQHDTYNAHLEELRKKYKVEISE